MMESLKIFKSLCDETRLKIITLLLDGEKCVCDIAYKVGKTQSTVSIQLAKLKRWGVIGSRRDKKCVYYTLVNNKIPKILEIVNDNLRDETEKQKRGAKLEYTSIEKKNVVKKH